MWKHDQIILCEKYFLNKKDIYWSISSLSGYIDQQASIANSSSTSGRTSLAPHSSVLKFWMACSCVDAVHAAAVVNTFSAPNAYVYYIYVVWYLV